MPISYFHHNLSLLKKNHPDLANRLNSLRPEKRYRVIPSRKGSATLVRILPDGRKKNLHSAYDPVKEAESFIKGCDIQGSTNFLVMGFGLGYHVLELLKKVPSNAKIFILEKDPGLLALAFKYQDFSFVLSHPGVVFLLGTDVKQGGPFPNSDIMELALKGFVPLIFKPLVEVEKDYYDQLFNKINTTIREAKIDLNTHAAFSRVFYRNIIDNWRFLLISPGIRELSQKFSGMPAVVVSAGPSLDKNIGLLKQWKEKGLVITVATALKPLLNAGVEPDFVVALDSDDSTIHAFNTKSLPRDLWLVYGPCIPNYILSLFPNRMVAFDSGVPLSQWIAEHLMEKGSLGKTFSVAHSAFLFAKHLGCQPIVLAGQDLAFDGHRLHCSNSFYQRRQFDLINRIHTLNILEQKKFEGYLPSLAHTKNLFGQNTETTIALEVYKDRYAEEINGECPVLNATEGGNPIPNVINLTLRHILNSIPGPPKYFNKNKVLKSLSPKKINLHVSKTLRKKNMEFSCLVAKLREIESRFLKQDMNSRITKKNFVQEMENFYHSLLSCPQTLRLAQGYLFSGFIEWNLENSRIMARQESLAQEEVLELKFKRDKTFFPVLLESVSFLEKSFREMASLKIN